MVLWSGGIIAKHMNFLWCIFQSGFASVHLTPVLLFVVFLLHEENDDLSEDLDEINEEIQSVSDEVSVSTTSLEDDDLSVKHDEATEDGQAKVDVNLEQELGPEEDVEEPQKDEGAEAGEKGAAKVEVLAVGSEERCA